MSRTSKQKVKHRRRQMNTSAATHARRAQHRGVAVALDRARSAPRLPDFVRWMP